jgi:hypothetical protein
MDVWDEDLSNEEYESKMKKLEIDSIERKIATIGFNEGMEDVPTDEERQKGFEQGFLVGSTQNFHYGEILGEIE